MNEEIEDRNVLYRENAVKRKECKKIKFRNMNQFKPTNKI